MENLIEYQNNNESESKIEVVFDYSTEDEKERVFRTLKKHSWYKENGYKPKYLKLIQEKLEKEENIKEEDVLEAVLSEFDKNKYAEQIGSILEEWNKIKGGFLKI